MRLSWVKESMSFTMRMATLSSLFRTQINREGNRDGAGHWSGFNSSCCLQGLDAGIGMILRLHRHAGPK
jgi:hypothetical protein